MDGRREHADVVYFPIAEATTLHPRNDSASIVELNGNELFIVWIEMHESELAGHDEAPYQYCVNEVYRWGHDME